MTAVSWKMIQHGWAVHSSDGQDIGRVFMVVGDENEDIFDGLAITHHRGVVMHNYTDRPRYVEASQVGEIDDSERVTLKITAEESADLPIHDAPESARIEPGKASMVDRLRSGIEHLTREDRTN